MSAIIQKRLIDYIISFRIVYNTDRPGWDSIRFHFHLNIAIAINRISQCELVVPQVKLRVKYSLYLCIVLFQFVYRMKMVISNRARKSNNHFNFITQAKA